MNVVDASVWVSYFNHNDINHIASRDWIQQQLDNNDSLIGPMLVLSEVGGAISRRVGQVEANQAIAYLRGLPLLVLFELDEALGLVATNLAITLQLRGADAIYVEVAQ